MDRGVLYRELKQAGVKDPSGLVAQAEVFGSDDNLFGLRQEDSDALGIDAGVPQENFLAAVELENQLNNTYRNDELTRAAFIAGAPEAVDKSQLRKVSKVQAEIRKDNEPRKPKDNSAEMKKIIRQILDRREAESAGTNARL